MGILMWELLMSFGVRVAVLIRTEADIQVEAVLWHSIFRCTLLINRRITWFS